ncbi:MAG TPA: hypothetical protein DFI01_04525, partial [Bacteroidales bacterium]|nr:hypothetical protein [Bacteroidales bacterium]
FKINKFYSVFLIYPFTGRNRRHGIGVGHEAQGTGHSAQGTVHRARSTGFARCSWPKIAKDWRRGEGEKREARKMYTHNFRKNCSLM